MCDKKDFKTHRRQRSLGSLQLKEHCHEIYSKFPNEHNMCGFGEKATASRFGGVTDTRGLHCITHSAE
jgi:hypothetical protein